VFLGTLIIGDEVYKGRRTGIGTCITVIKKDYNPY